MTDFQTTLREPITFEGVGLHTGTPCRVDVLPAPVGTGLRFTLDGQVSFPAHAEYVIETARATVLGKDGKTVSTVEHLLAAIFGMGLCNAQIEVHGPEIPVADGSSKTFATAIAQVGLAAQAEARERYVLSHPFFARDAEKTIIALPASSFRVKFAVD
jgi:UDP-3-O-[3-hydroxymyristoyl] N-acetylglucosamine deacetylase